jgi:4-carboxymuconolactone decarboxylase
MVAWQAWIAAPADLRFLSKDEPATSRRPAKRGRSTMADEARIAGIAAFREMFPGLIPEGTTSVRDGSFADELGDLAMDHVFGSLWTRPGLDRRSRSLITLGALIALHATEELAFHFPIAINNGVTVAELEEVIYHLSAYAGFPAASAARTVAASTLPAGEP